MTLKIEGVGEAGRKKKFRGRNSASSYLSFHPSIFESSYSIFLFTYLLFLSPTTFFHAVIIGLGAYRSGSLIIV